MINNRREGVQKVMVAKLRLRIAILRYLLSESLLLLVLAESLGTSAYAFICHRSKILSLFQLLDKFCMKNIY